MRRKIRWVGKLSVAVFLTMFVVTSMAPNVLAQDPITLTFYSRIWELNVKRVIKNLADSYAEENPNVRVKIIWGSTGASREYILKSVVAGTLADVFEGHARFSLEFGPRGHFIDLSPYISTKEYNDFLEYGWEGADALTPPIYCIPNIQGLHVTFFRKDLLSEVGGRVATVEDPWDWPEFVDIMKKLTKDRDGDGETDQWGWMFVPVARSFTPSIWTTGCEFYAPDPETGKWRVKFDENGRRGLQFFDDWFRKYKIAPTALMGMKTTPMIAGLVAGDYATHNSGVFTRRQIIEAGGEEFLQNKIGVMPWPVDKTNPDRRQRFRISFADVMGYSVSAHSKHIEQAVDFLKYMVKPEHMAKYCEAEFNIPPRKSVLAMPNFQTDKYHWKQIVEMAPAHARPLPTHPTWSEFQERVFVPDFQLLALGEITVDECIENLEKKGNQIIQEWYKKTGK